MINIVGSNVNAVFHEALCRFRADKSIVATPSRNGPVLSFPQPVCLHYLKPTERVLFAKERDPNPFFHFMEALWMLAGCNDVAFPSQFAANIKNYSDDGQTLNGAYGHRWREHFSIDQVHWAIELLKRDPNTRRAVLGMWDPMSDPWHIERNTKDVPCNTHIYFRILGSQLDMTVCNRSNDLIWGACGANAVHMSYLQEFIASAVGCSVGNYYQITNNLHIYTSLPTAKPLIDCPPLDDHYNEAEPCVKPFALVQPGEDWKNVLLSIEEFVTAPMEEGKTKSAIIEQVARPMYTAWVLRRTGMEKEAFRNMHQIVASDWKLACLQWAVRRTHPQARLMEQP